MSEPPVTAPEPSAEVRDRVETSAHVLQRFRGKLVLVAVVALADTALGVPVARPLAILCFASAAILLVQSRAARAAVLAPHFTRVDAAAWFLALGHLAAAYGA